MSDPMTNIEIQDVLSSIRRLVSEDNRHRAERDRAERDRAAGAVRPVETEAEPATGPESGIRSEPGSPDAALSPAADPGKFVLTAALRVAAGSPAMSPLALDEAVAGDGRFTSDDSLPSIAEAEATGGDTWEHAGGDAAEIAASLEGTIAELEAAVAGIGGEFEPDGSEVAKGVPLDAELEEAFEESFPVDLAAEEEVAALAQPVTAGPVVPARPAPVDAAVADAIAVGQDTASQHAAAAAAQFRHLHPVSPDVQSVSQIVPEGGADLTGQSHLPTDHFEPHGATVDATLTAAVPSFVHSSVGRQTSEPGLCPDRSRPVIHRRLTLTAADCVTEQSAAWDRGGAAPESAETDRPAVSDAPPGEGPGTAPGLVSAIADEPIPSSGEEADTGESLFGPSDDGQFDMDMLRDLVAEIIREELQGALGERITRNVRMLVRREINRALEARGLE